MGIDDAKAASDSKSHSHFSNRLKKYTANASMVYNQKYRRTASLPWYGRIVITCNLDADSLRILPDMDMSNKDKISLFKASDSIPKFPEGARAQALREIPAFARFLVDWEAPEHWKGNGVLRFGVRHYHHPDLFAESRQQGHGVLMELLHNTFEAYQKGHPEAEYWEGRATILYQDICTANPEAAKEIRSAKALSMALGKLAKNGYDLCKHKDVKTNLNIWKISLNICNSGEEGGNNE
jgi:hypothetical protein